MTVEAQPRITVYEHRSCVQVVNHDARWMATCFPCGAEAPSIPQDTPTYRAEADARGYEGIDLWRYSLEHEWLHVWLAEKLGLPFSPTIHSAAHHPGAWWVKGDAKGILLHGWPVTMAREENWVKAFSRALMLDTRLDPNLSDLTLAGLDMDALAVEARALLAGLRS